MSTFPAERTAIVTGAVSERGIGRATANYLAAQGWNIGIIDLDDARCKAAAKESPPIRCPGRRRRRERRRRGSVRAAIDASRPNFRRSSPSPTWPASARRCRTWNSSRRVGPRTNINLNGVHYATRRVAESMVKNRIGRIVNISSVSAQRGGGTFSKTPYSVAKAGVIGLTRSIARELGEYDITVNAISPGPIDTDIMGGTLSEERKDELTKDLVVNRVGSTARHRSSHRLPHQRGRRLHLRPDAECGWRTLHALEGAHGTNTARTPRGTRRMQPGPRNARSTSPSASLPAWPAS